MSDRACIWVLAIALATVPVIHGWCITRLGERLAAVEAQLKEAKP